MVSMVSDFVEFQSTMCTTKSYSVEPMAGIMSDRETSEKWKRAILAKLYERQPRRVDIAVEDVRNDSAVLLDDENELFDAVVEDLRTGGLIVHSLQVAPEGLFFDAKITLLGIKHFENTYLSSAPRNSATLVTLDRIRDILIAVSTGGSKIQTVDAEYRSLFGQLNEQLSGLGIDNPIPFPDLWVWYGRWSSGDLPSYQSRRQFVAELIEPLAARLRSGRSAPAIIATGWSLVDQQIGVARRQLETAQSGVEYQSVGLSCREALLSLAKEVFIPARHPIIDGTEVGPSDFKRMIEAYIAVELAGSSAEGLRKHARSALDLANQTTHKRAAEFRDAALCLEATASVVNIIAIVSGRRDP